MAMSREEYLVYMENITKRFPGVLANDNVTFRVRKGEIHSLLGENGAGKSTLMNILYGYYRPDSGRILIRGEEVCFNSPSDAIKHGIGMVFQHFNLVDSLTVLENIILGDGSIGFIPDYERAREELEKIIEKYGFKINLDEVISNLSVGEKQRVEILKLLYQHSDILIFDEPTTVLTPREKEILFKFFREVSREGASIIFITHKLEEALEVSDVITVMRRGRVIATLEPGETDIYELARLMVGRVEKYKVNERGRPGRVVLKVDDLWVRDDLGRYRLRGASLEVREGEIVGIAGVSGNGQKELVEAIVGLRNPEKGSIEVCNEDVTFAEPREVFERGVIVIPEDRNYEGLFMEASVYENLISRVYTLSEYTSKTGIMNHNRLREYASNLIREYEIQTPNLEIPVKALSGGNRQRVVLAREFSYNGKRKKVIVAVYPSRGLDVRATNFVRMLLTRERADGRGILLISDDLDEIFELSDRILVISDGRIVKEYTGGEVDQEELGLMISGVLR